MTLYRILYRASLSSCNYDCAYCPFAKTRNTRSQLREDARQLERFVDWVGTAGRPLGIFFTPWGEALVHPHYRQALVRLSRMPHVRRVAIQTNLSGPVADLASADPHTLAFWATFHPAQTTPDRFLGQCRKLQEMRFRFSVGAVGLPEHFDAIAELRSRLSPSVYLWINCLKRDPDAYGSRDLAFLRQIDPYVGLNRVDYPSRGAACRAGESVFSVDGHGNVRPCHFVDRQIGNLYRDDIFTLLAPGTCPNTTCGCHIGYVHRPDLDLYRLFGDNVLERIPADWPLVQPAFTHPGEMT
ncbi:MAG: STM4011 family radical SAM protein [Thermoguttaceae bacterium]